MTNKEIKELFIDALMTRAQEGVYTRRVNDVEYRTRCPICGDSSKNENTGHCYIKVNPDDNSPMVFHCFLCEEGGEIKPSFITLLGIEDLVNPNAIKALNKSSDKIDRKGLVNNISVKNFEFELPPVIRGAKTEYVENRLGVKLNDEDFKKMKLITSLRDFLVYNKIKKLTCSNQIAFNIEEKYVGFLSYGNSHILFRDITNTQEISWFKYPILKESSVNRIFYSMESEIDLFTEDEIIINMAEGVMDTLSANYNLGFNGSNTLNLCVSGRYYNSMIMFLISMGFVGSNITINIFADNDARFNNKNSVQTTSLEYYKNIMKKSAHLFGKVNVYYNLKSKDIGVPKDEIRLQKFQIS